MSVCSWLCLGLGNIVTLQGTNIPRQTRHTRAHVESDYPCSNNFVNCWIFPSYDNLPRHPISVREVSLMTNQRPVFVPVTNQKPPSAYSCESCNQRLLSSKSGVQTSGEDYTDYAERRTSGIDFREERLPQQHALLGHKLSSKFKPKYTIHLTVLKMSVVWFSNPYYFNQSETTLENVYEP